jgi:ATP-binding cassette subfamily B (MDR/TAP) protein 1
LSTIKKADKIVVLNKGKIVQEGTHESLLDDVDGVYYNLVHAQALCMESEIPAGGEDVRSSTSSDLRPTCSKKSGRSRRGSAPAGDDLMEDQEYKERGIVRSFGLLLYEQRKRWVLYSLTLISAMGCGCKSYQVFPSPPFFFFACSIMGAAICVP